ncbi:MAG: sodium:proton antiporter [Candidatus Thermoplasmatota archaeon]|nr:sodium:proton antiporter [Candidatus Thermoplasmatota archaeon]
MSKIVRTLSNIAFPFIMIFGFYVIAHGHLTPGGGFQGGAVVASGCIMLLVAYGSTWVFEKIKVSRLSVFESLGALGFIGVAFFGLLFGGWFFNNFLVRNGILFNIVPKTGSTAAEFNTAGVLPLMNFAVGVKVIAGLFVIVLVMAYASSLKEWKQ